MGGDRRRGGAGSGVAAGSAERPRLYLVPGRADLPAKPLDMSRAERRSAARLRVEAATARHRSRMLCREASELRDRSWREAYVALGLRFTADEGLARAAALTARSPFAHGFRLPTAETDPDAPLMPFPGDREPMVCEGCGREWLSPIAPMIVAQPELAHCAMCGGELVLGEPHPG